MTRVYSGTYRRKYAGKRAVSMKRKRPSRVTRVTRKRRGLARRNLLAAGTLYPVTRSLSPFPMHQVTRHKYVENVTVPAAAVAGDCQIYTFVINDMFDPNFTGTGHQPMFRDEMAARYTYYTVLAAYLKVTFDQTTTNQGNYALILTKDSALTNEPTLLLEQWSTTKPLITAQRNGPLSLRRSFDAKKFFQTSHAGLMSDDSLRTAVGSSPTAPRRAFVHIVMAPLDEGIILPAQKIQVELIHICSWRDVVDAVQS